MEEIKIINEVQSLHKAVAITFDDGPNPIYTQQLLQIFQEVGGKATFYMIGDQMIKHPEIVKTVVDQKHEIGNHSYSHPKLTQIQLSDCETELTRTDQIITEMTGIKPATFRPPYLDYNEVVISISEKLGCKVIGALNLDALDWEQPGIDFILSKTRNHIRSGSILLFHDSRGDRSQTVEAVRILATELKEQGYQLVTVSELLQLSETGV
ncbi:polysaccharide deacetylase [Anaerobacillus alkalilacustris]|uniref:Polysaccharide deacetylase n=1 Tax=Anaerobacillus alkalilacustris TaxID=393763 RepID=A0A1S2LN44_9BACI|nr:polysaccharide deacetylase family protein [Anaerobacillus alkalilacustris]OIJ13932.1 polysaccharide deacetylase [Anaerobacillus alkalilacustris]